ncbi:MAG TPA: helix-turn-helix domain-containing protein, partial [Verrucomicrobiae bacterium]|nr:helix-turn-helix domain-containing protein [Verrucomicrobiae bacterium]
MNSNENLIETLVNSQMYQDYERAYSEATGMPVTLRSPVTWQLPLHGKRKENPFCALVAGKSRACAACLQMQEKLCQNANQTPATMSCTYGLCETAVPVRMGNETIGFLQTGQVMLRKPSAKQVERMSEQLREHGLDTNPEAVKRAYFQTPLVSQKKLDSMTHLLSVFADHLAMKGNQIALQKVNAEPPVITKARHYIEEHHTDEISLGQVAAAVHTSTFYFCKMFKRITGINFTEYVSRVRAEKAKNLLLNPNLRISEIAYAVGFQSLTHFNRIFKKIVGQSPTEYRLQLPK